MLRRILKSAGCVLMCLFLVSCGTTLKSSHYVGVQEPVDEKELNKESIWTFEDEVIYVRAVEPNRIVASSLRWDSSEKEYKVETFPILLTRLDEYTFLNLKDVNNTSYSIYRLIPAMDGALILFSADKENIKKHVDDGKIRAAEKDGGFIIEASKEDLDSYVRNNMNEIFDYSVAHIVKPLKRIKDKE